MSRFLAVQLVRGYEVFPPMLKIFKPSFAVTYIAFLLKKCLHLICVWNFQLSEIEQGKYGSEVVDLMFHICLCLHSSENYFIILNLEQSQPPHLHLFPQSDISLAT